MTETTPPRSARATSTPRSSRSSRTSARRSTGGGPSWTPRRRASWPAPPPTRTPSRTPRSRPIFPPAERQALSRRSTCAALAMATRTPERTVQRATNDAERLVNDAPAVLASLEAGRISARHAQTITDQLSDVPTAGRAAFLAEVLAGRGAVDHRAGSAARARVLRERLHPESITARAVRSEADRRVEFEPAADGMAWVHLFTTAPIAQGIIERVEAAAAESRALATPAPAPSCRPTPSRRSRSPASPRTTSCRARCSRTRSRCRSTSSRPCRSPSRR